MKIFKIFFVIGMFVALFFIFHHFGCAKGENVAIDIGTLDTPTNVKVNAAFTYDFDKAVQINTVTTSTFFILPTPTPKAATSSKMVLSTQKSYDASICDPTKALLATVTCSSNVSCVLEPKEILEFSTSYTICLTTGILYEDETPFEGYTLQIITEEDPSSAESTTPKVVSVSPTENSVGFAKNGSVSISFNKDIDDTTLLPTTFYVSKITDGMTNEIAGSIAYDSKQFKATFTATDDFPSETQCIVNVSKKIKDKEGQNLDKDYEWSFTTGDFVAPTITEYFPNTGTVSESDMNDGVSVDFSESIDSSTVTSLTFIVEIQDQRSATIYDVVSGVLSTLDNKVMFKADSNMPFTQLRKYRVTIKDDIKDLAGNGLEQGYQWMFTVTQ